MVTKRKRPEDLLPKGFEPRRVPRDVVRKVCAEAAKAKVPTLDPFFRKHGVQPHLVKQAYIRVQEDSPWKDADDEFLVDYCTVTQATIEVECLKDWRDGNREVAHLLQNLVKKYNAAYQASVNQDVAQFMRVARQFVTPEQYVNILSAIVDMEPALQLEDDGGGYAMPRLPSAEEARDRLDDEDDED